jgi:hypothetical protein
MQGLMLSKLAKVHFYEADGKVVSKVHPTSRPALSLNTLKRSLPCSTEVK